MCSTSGGLKGRLFSVDSLTSLFLSPPTRRVPELRCRQIGAPGIWQNNDAREFRISFNGAVSQTTREFDGRGNRLSGEVDDEKRGRVGGLSHLDLSSRCT